MKRHLAALACFVLAGSSGYADSWALKPEVKDTEYVFGDTRVVLHYDSTRPVIPQIVVDISSVYEKRSRALHCFRSQFFHETAEEDLTRIGHPEFFDWVDGWLRRYGFFIGASYGEAFTSPEPVPVFDIVAQLGRAKWERPNPTQ